jgi:hypothetical protein
VSFKYFTDGIFLNLKSVKNCINFLTAVRRDNQPRGRASGFLLLPLESRSLKTESQESLLSNGLSKGVLLPVILDLEKQYSNLLPSSLALSL